MIARSSTESSKLPLHWTTAAQSEEISNKAVCVLTTQCQHLPLFVETTLTKFQQHRFNRLLVGFHPAVRCVDIWGGLLVVKSLFYLSVACHATTVHGRDHYPTSFSILTYSSELWVVHIDDYTSVPPLNRQSSSSSAVSLREVDCHGAPFLPVSTFTIDA